MKFATTLLSLLLLTSCVSGKEKIYIASTPAGAVVRSFLGINMSDSIDFVRWKLTVINGHYKLYCNYGISQPNTNGLINNGKKLEIDGSIKENKNSLILQHGNKTLKIGKLNNDVLHLMDEYDKLLVGNDGWSYTLNNNSPVGSNELNITSAYTTIKDSIAFAGRTPCKIPGVIPAGKDCYKIKWIIILYTDGVKNRTGSYKILGTPYRSEGGRTGKWEILTGKEGSITFLLNDSQGNPMLRLLKLDENIVIFIDTDGRLLTGDEDFSYTLNRRY